MTLPEWPQIARIVWTSGGIVAVNNPGPEVQIGAGLGGRMLGSLRIPTYASLLEILRQQGFSVIGTTFVEGQEEALGLRPPQFRALSDSEGWLVWDTHQQWRQIAHAASRRDHMPLMDVASRIASGLAYSEMRLHDLAEAYGKQLRGCLHANERKDYRRFADTNSAVVYKAIHALFWEMAVLRDTLAEFVARFCFARANVTSLTMLIKSLGKKSSADPLAVQIMDAADETKKGWLSKFSVYRNLFTHYAPMEQAAGIAFAVLDTRVLAPDRSIPQIYYPLPPDAADIRNRRSRGPLFDTFNDLVNASSGRRPERTNEPDALEYLCGCFDQMAQLSRMLAARSPLNAEPIHLGPDDIIGEVRIS